MIVVGIDPSNEHTGLANVRAAARLQDRLVELRAITMFQGDPVRSVLERIHPTLHAWLPGARLTDVAIYVEMAPPTARADVDHGPQAAIGFAQGWLAAASAGPWLGRCPVELVGPTDWRSRMIVEAARAGLLLDAPTRRGAGAVMVDASTKIQRFGMQRDGAEYVRVWAGCGHRERFVNYQALHDSQATRCPDCAKAPEVPKGVSEADAIREAWKELACRFVAHFWPEQYAALVAGPRARAHTHPPDHKLAGVADACEAVGIALYGLDPV